MPIHLPALRNESDTLHRRRIGRVPKEVCVELAMRWRADLVGSVPNTGADDAVVCVFQAG